jgi:hypothetical protein
MNKDQPIEQVYIERDNVTTKQNILQRNCIHAQELLKPKKKHCFWK